MTALMHWHIQAAPLPSWANFDKVVGEQGKRDCLAMAPSMLLILWSFYCCLSNTRFPVWPPLSSQGVKDRNAICACQVQCLASFSFTSSFSPSLGLAGSPSASTCFIFSLSFPGSCCHWHHFSSQPLKQRALWACVHVAPAICFPYSAPRDFGGLPLEGMGVDYMRGESSVVTRASHYC